MVNRFVIILTISAFLLFFIQNISASCSDGQIDINIASLDELDQLYGIGPVKAQAIIDARPFDNIDELIEVNGIGQATLDGIKSQELACVENEVVNNDGDNGGNNDKTGTTEENDNTSSEEITQSGDNSQGTNDESEIIRKTLNTSGDGLVENNTTLELQPISLNYPSNNSKGIKSGENSEILSRDKIAMYSFFVFSVVIVVLLVIRRKKIYENDFR